MPHHCAAYGCKNRRTVGTRDQGITFHRFPKDKALRKKWEAAVRRKAFTATVASVLCSQHFKQSDFDRTGQTVRLRDGVIPSAFCFSRHLKKLEKDTATSTSRGAEESPSVAPPDSPKKTISIPQPQHPQPQHPQLQPNDDHGYALPDSPTTLRTRLKEALAKVESLEREKKNAMAREKRAKTMVNSLMGDLREKNLINEELKEKLDFYSNFPMDFMTKQGHEYTKEYKEFALTLHLHGAKVYSYLRDTCHFPLPHPHTLQRWLRDDGLQASTEQDGDAHAGEMTSGRPG